MNSFKLVLLASAMTAGLAVAAHAADVTPPEPETTTPDQYQAMGFYLRGDLGWSFLDWGDDDNAFAVGCGVGYQFNDYLRSDVRVDWSGAYSVGDGADANLTTVLGNMYFDWRNDTAFTPYVGAGAGWGWLGGDESDDGFTYALMAGVSVDMSQSISLDFGYRYRELMLDGENPADHSALAGIRFKF